MRIGAHELAHEAHGPEDGQPILFVHGLTADRRSLALPFEPIFADVPGRWRRFYVDLPGHGGSPGDPALASADFLVEALVAFAGTTCDSPPAIVGHSYGGYLAQGLARDIAPVLPGMFLVCPVVEPDFVKRRVLPERVVEKTADVHFASPDEQRTFAGETVVQTAAMLERWRAAMESGHRVQDHAFVNAVRARYVMSRPHLRALADLTCPVAIVEGRDDAVTGFEDALLLVRTIRDVTYTVLPRCGHLPQLEAAEPLAMLFRAWLSRL
jgi:pimeloyl-ACP methyl ester carboxylesterase